MHVLLYRTLFCTINPVTRGLMMPGSVPAILDSPISTPACCGAMSRWLTLEALIRVAINIAVCYTLLLASVVLVAVFVCMIDRHYFGMFDRNLSNADKLTRSQPRRSRRVPLPLTDRPQRRLELAGTSLAAWRPSGWHRPHRWTASWPAVYKAYQIHPMWRSGQLH